MTAARRSAVIEAGLDPDAAAEFLPLTDEETDMDPAKRAALEAAGFRFGTAKDFLGLSDEENNEVEERVGARRDGVFTVGPFKGYAGEFRFEPETGGYFGEVLTDGPDVVTFQGKDFDEAGLEFARAIDDYLAHCERSGHTPDAPEQS